MALPPKQQINPLDWRTRIVNDDGTPNNYFIRLWQTMFGNSNSDSKSIEELQTEVDVLDNAEIQAGTGISISPDGHLKSNPTVALNASIGDLNDVDLSTPPTNNQVLVYDDVSGTWKPAAQSGGGGGSTTYWAVQATGTGISQNITLPLAVTATNEVSVYVNGVYYETDEYTVSGTTLTMTSNAAGDSIEVRGENFSGGGGGSGSWTELAYWDFAVSGATSSVIADVTGYNDVLVKVLNVTAASSTNRSFQVSTDGGLTYYTGAGDYPDVSSAGGLTNQGAYFIHSTASSGGRYGAAIVSNVSGTRIGKPLTSGNRNSMQLFMASASPITHIRVVSIAGGSPASLVSMTGGTIQILAR